MRLILTIIVSAIFLTGCDLKKNNPVEPVVDPAVYKIRNGGFEDSHDGVKPIHWKESVTGSPEFNFFSLNEQDYKEGKRSLQVNYVDSLSNPDPVNGSWGGLSYKIETTEWDRKKDYKLSFWVKATQGNFHVRVTKNGRNDSTFVFYTAENAPDWEYKEFPFNITGDTNYLNILISTKSQQSVNGRVTGWLDDVKIIYN